MLLHAGELADAPQREIEPGCWELAKPVPGPFVVEVRERLRAAWAVLKGNACAVRWYA